MTITITLPWPPSETSSNASGQGKWRKKTNAARSYKDACAWSCAAQGIKRAAVGFQISDSDVPVTITYHPPTDHRVDWDNLAGRAKQGFDAVAEAVGVDDGRWWPVLSVKGDKAKDGKVVVTLHDSAMDQVQAMARGCVVGVVS